MQLADLFSSALEISAPWKITSVEFDSSTKKMDIKVDFVRGASFAYTDEKNGKRYRVIFLIF